ncbi:MAG: gamma-glutamylcyclotransferase, partial [Zwartia sp.]
GKVLAMAFVINRNGPAYVQEPPEDDLVNIILKAHGTYGSCLDYVTQTAIALKTAGIFDERLAQLAKRLEQQQQQQ